MRRAKELAHEFQAMVRQRQAEAFDGWVQACGDSGIAELQSFAKGLIQEEASIRAALSEPMYGRAGLDVLRLRVLSAA